MVDFYRTLYLGSVAMFVDVNTIMWLKGVTKFSLGSFENEEEWTATMIFIADTTVAVESFIYW